jgi:hypothetical protein
LRPNQWVKVIIRPSSNPYFTWHDGLCLVMPYVQGRRRARLPGWLGGGYLNQPIAPSPNAVPYVGYGWFQRHSDQWEKGTLWVSWQPMSWWRRLLWRWSMFWA